MSDGRILRGPIAFRSKRIKMTAKQRARKKNQFFELKGLYKRRARILVPYFKKAYVRKWEQKSLPVWYREHWQNLEVENEIPPVFQRTSTARNWRT